MSSNQSDYYNMPRVAIIGRPNVGKSTFFNILTDSRKAVVKNQPGVTRDIQIEQVELWGRNFEIIDTGGITEATDEFSQLVKAQVKEFLAEADFLIVVMDGRSGLLPEDRDVIKIAKSVGKEAILVVNKVDKVSEEDLVLSEFYEFGMPVVATSFETRRGISQVLEWIYSHLPEKEAAIFDGPSLAIVGKPNVGKSSLVNALLGEERMLVSEIAGTTVDAIDTPFLYKGKKYRLIDTAGLRRSSKREDDVEIISAFKSQESIRRANVVLMVIDCTVGPTDQDAKILSLILESHKGVVLVANKSDLGREEMENYRKWFKEKVEQELHFFPDIPMVFTSAKTGHGLRELLDQIEDVSRKLNFKIPTGELNDFFFETIRKAPAPVYGTNNVKFFYLTQTLQKPPSFIAFANYPDGVTPGYRRFLIKHIKERWSLQGIPIRIFVMKSRKGSND